SDVRFWGRFGKSWPSPVVITLNGDATITAAFVPANAPTLQVGGGYGSGSGTVTSSPAGIDCHATEVCKVFVAPGTQVTLTATADSGSSLTGWEARALTGQDWQEFYCRNPTVSTCEFTVTGNTWVMAIFQSSPPPPPPPPPPPKMCVVP